MNARTQLAPVNFQVIQARNNKSFERNYCVTETRWPTEKKICKEIYSVANIILQLYVSDIIFRIWCNAAAP